MGLSIGEVVATFDANIKGFDAGIKKAESQMSGFVGGVDKAGKSVGKSIKSMGDGMQSLGKNISLYVTTPLTIAFGLLTKQAIDQVKQVQNASFGLKAYEKDANKVSSTLQGLVEYAQSDMGVLFQRQDLFQAASTLRVYGNETDTLVNKVKTLSKGVSLGTTTFAELSQIIGETTQASFLTSENFDQLARRGIKIDSVFRNSAISTEKLFQELEKVLPDELLAGRANTIEGQMIRLQSAFRNVGATILGVNKGADGFMPGSLGERIFAAGDAIKGFVRSAEFLEVIRRSAERLAEMFDFVANKVTNLYNWFMSLNIEQRNLIADVLVLTTVLGPLLVVLGTLIGLVGFAITPLLSVGGAILAIASAILITNPGLREFLLNTVKKGTEAVKGLGWAWEWLKPSFELVGAVIRNDLMPAFGRFGQLVKDNEGGIRNFAGFIGAVLLGAIAGIVNTVGGAIWVFSKLLDIVTATQRALQGFGKGVKDTIGAVGGFLKGKIPGFANGVRNFAGGLAVVGERGPELVNLPQGADVFSNQESKGMMGGAGITIENMNIKSNVDWQLGTQYMAQKLRLS